MANSLGSLVVNLGLDAAEFTRGLTKAEYESQKFAKNVQEVAGQVGTLLAGAAIAGGSALVYMVKGAIDAADHLHDLSQQTGITVEALGGIGFAATQAGGNLESVVSAAGKLNKSLAEAAAGNKEAGEAFKVLGIDVKDAAGQTIKAEAAMVAIADKFAGFTDGPEKAALALRIFGKAGADQIALLNEGGKSLQDAIAYYQRYGGVSTEVAKQADEFNDTVGKLNLLMSSFGRELAADLLPTLQLIAGEFLRMREEAKATQGDFSPLAETFKALVVFGANVAYVLKGIGTEIGGIAAQIAALMRLDFKGFSAIGKAMKEDAKAAREAIDAFLARALNPAAGGANSSRADIFGGGPGGRVGPAPRLPGDKTAASQISEAQRYLEAITKQVEKTLDLTTAEQALIDIRKGMKGLTPAIERQILALAKEVDVQKAHNKSLEEAKQYREAAAKVEQAAVAATVAETEAMRKSNVDLQYEIDLLGADGIARAAIENARTQSIITIKEEDFANRLLAGSIGTVTKQLEDQIAELKERQRLTTTKADIENFQGVQKNAQETFDKFKKEADEASQYAKRASENIQDALGDTLLRTLKGDFASIGQLWSDLILKMISQALAARLNEKLFGKDGLGGLIGPALNAIFGGGDTGAGSVPGGGGPGMNNPSAYPGAGLESAASMGKGYGGGQIVQNINIGDYATRNDVMNAMTAAKEQAKAEIFRSQRSRGQFATS